MVFSPNEAVEMLQRVIDRGHLDKIIGVGLDSSEAGNPPRLFEEAFALARKHGLRCVAHAGEEGRSSLAFCVDNLSFSERRNSSCCWRHI